LRAVCYSNLVTLKKFYLIWMISAFLAGLVATAFMYSGIYLQYGTISPSGEMAGVFYFWGALILFVVATGLITALISHNFFKRHDKVFAKKLGSRVAIFYIAAALPIVWMTVLGLPIFALLPYFAWESAHSKKKFSNGTLILVLAMIAVVVWGIGSWVILINSIH
jgi:multisubunit Na+/H+ antiporter MnhB subunit